MLTKTKRRLGPQVIVVLGGGLLADGTPGPMLILRAQAAARLATEHRRATIIVSGDGRKNRQDPNAKTEAYHLSQLLIQMGIPERRLWIEDESIDTVGNAVLVFARYLRNRKPRPLYLVTSPFHMERATIAFRGVFGARWRIEPQPSEPARDDRIRALMEGGGIDWMQRFFAGVEPGDLPAVVARLHEVGKPFYRTLDWLSGSEGKAA